MGWVADQITNAINGILSRISEELVTLIEGLVSMILRLFTSTPYPGSNQPDVTNPIWYTPPDPSTTSNPGMWSELYHSVYMGDVMPFAIAVFVLAAAFTYGLSWLNNISSLNYVSTASMESKLMHAFLGIMFWWQIGTAILYISETLALAFAGCSTSGACGAYDIPSGGGGAIVFAAILVYFVSASTLIFIAMFWLFRYVALIIGFVTAPLLIALWAFDIGPMKIVSGLAGDILRLFVVLSFASIPAGLVVRIAYVGGSVLDGILSSALGNGALANGVGSLVETMFYIAIPVAAGLTPIYVFKMQSKSATNTRFGGQLAGKINSTISDENADKIDASARVASKSAYEGEHYEYDDGELVEVDDPEDASWSSRFGVGTRSTASTTADKAEDVAGTAGTFAADYYYHEDAREEMRSAVARKAGRKSGHAEHNVKSTVASAAEKPKNAFNTAADTLGRPVAGFNDRRTTIKQSRTEDVEETWANWLDGESFVDQFGREFQDTMTARATRARKDATRDELQDLTISRSQMGEDGSPPTMTLDGSEIDDLTNLSFDLKETEDITTDADGNIVVTAKRGSDLADIAGDEDVFWGDEKGEMGFMDTEGVNVDDYDPFAFLEGELPHQQEPDVSLNDPASREERAEERVRQMREERREQRNWGDDLDEGDRSDGSQPTAVASGDEKLDKAVETLASELSADELEDVTSSKSDLSEALTSIDESLEAQTEALEGFNSMFGEGDDENFDISDAFSESLEEHQQWLRDERRRQKRLEEREQQRQETRSQSDSGSSDDTDDDDGFSGTGTSGTPGGI